MADKEQVIKILNSPTCAACGKPVKDESEHYLCQEHLEWAFEMHPSADYRADDAEAKKE